MSSTEKDARLGYLQHVIDGLEVASPDRLHGTVRLAPLAGLSFPMLQILADMNDTAIDAGPVADLAALQRLRTLTTRRVVAEQQDMRSAPAGAIRSPDADERRVRGELMTVEVLLLGAPERLLGLAVERLRAVASKDLTAGQRHLRDAVVADLDRGDVDAALLPLRSLLVDCGVRPLPVAG